MRAMSSRGQRILVIGQNSPLLEGVSDLLQLSGYKVDVSSTWAETEYALVVTPPNLAIVDLSSSASDAFSLSESLRKVSRWADVPILFISFSGDDRIRDLQRHNRNPGDRRLQFYAHTLLGVDGLVEKVRTCLS
jgi:PleD family two-component response regulator